MTHSSHKLCVLTLKHMNIRNVYAHIKYNYMYIYCTHTYVHCVPIMLCTMIHVLILSKDFHFQVALSGAEYIVYVCV